MTTQTLLKILLILPLLIVSLLCFTVRAQSDVSNREKLVFAGGYPTGKGIKFDPPAPVDWRSLAPHQYDTLSRAKIRELSSQKDDYDNADIEYLADIPPEFAEKHFYLISPDGFTELTVRQVKGTVRIKFAYRSDAMESRIDFGSFVGMPKNGDLPKSGGFVVMTSEAQAFDKSKVAIDVTALKQSTGRYSSLKQETKVTAADFWQIVTAFSFQCHGDSASYDFIQLAPDVNNRAGGCKFRYLITTTAPSLDIIAWNYFGCDV